MNDDRTPYERAVGHEGDALADYRNSKRVLKLQDPDFSICPKCQAPVLGKHPERCGACMTVAEDAERAKKLADKAAQKGSLLQKAKAEETTREEKARWWNN